MYTHGIAPAFLALGFTLLLFAFFFVTIVGNILTGVPSLPSSKRVAEEMVRFADLKGNETVYDLGAGDGRILIAAKRFHGGLRAIGWEYVPTIWLIGKLRILWSGTKVTLHLGNALKQDIRDADCLFLYLIPEVMAELEEKFDQELKPGTKVVSAVFGFPHHQPVAEREVPWLGTKRKIRLYRW